jgi:hypothetical protein
MRGYGPLLLASLLPGALGCSEPPPSAPSRDGTARMADTLAVISAQARANPLANPFLSRERAEVLQAMLARQVGAAAVGTRKVPLGARPGTHQHQEEGP